MRNIIFPATLAVLVGLGTVGCEQDAMEEAGEDMDEAAEEAGDRAEEAAD
ncbi:MAG: hypothetical protein ACREVE_02410 [Gammaproteobacteria bacterium]